MDMLTAKTVAAATCIVSAAAVRIFAKPSKWTGETGFGWFLLIALIITFG